MKRKNRAASLFCLVNLIQKVGVAEYLVLKFNDIYKALFFTIIAFYARLNVLCRWGLAVLLRTAQVTYRCEIFKR